MDSNFKLFCRLKDKANAIISLCIAMAAFVLAACVPEPLDVDGIPIVKPQIVVSTQIIPDQSLVVLLTKTFGALEASDESDPQEVLDQIAVNDATVTITGPADTYNLIFLGNGFYGGIAIPFQANETYSLKVVSESLGEVTATTSVKPRINFDKVNAELYFNGYDDTLAQINYYLKDPEEKNYYMLNAQEVELAEVLENLLNPRSFTRLIDDIEFNGGTYAEQFRVFPRDFNRGDTLAVSLSNISDEYYHFLKLRIDNRFSFVEYLSEPVNYPTNINGGKGFFNLYIPDVRFFVLE